MRIRVSIAAAIAACLALAIAGSAVAATATKVTIKEQSDGFSGHVKSSKGKCVVSRVVVLYKQKPGKDKIIGTDFADENGAWSTGNTGSTKGAFYAYAPKVSGCKAGKSKTI